MSHKNPCTAAEPEGIPLIDCFMGQPVGLEEGSDQHRLGKRSSAFPERRGKPAPYSDAPQASLCLPISFLPNTMPLIPCQLSHRHRAALNAGLFSLNSSVSRQPLLSPPGNETELEENLPPLSFPSLRNGIGARTLETLAQTLPQSTDLLKEIKCFALRESQREWHHRLAQVVFSTLQIPLPVCGAHTGCHPHYTRAMWEPSLTSKHALSTCPFQQQVLQTGKSVTPTMVPPVQACTPLPRGDK